ncbi:MAG TPA: hypothetical protein VF007_13665 [Stellaceae bacterium]
MSKREQPKSPEPGSRPEPQPELHHVADEPVGEAGAADATVQSPTTETGLPVEEQIRKEWDPKKQGGLPTSLRRNPAKPGVA